MKKLAILGLTGALALGLASCDMQEYYQFNGKISTLIVGDGTPHFMYKSADGTEYGHFDINRYEHGLVVKLYGSVQHGDSSIVMNLPSNALSSTGTNMTPVRKKDLQVIVPYNAPEVDSATVAWDEEMDKKYHGNQIEPVQEVKSDTPVKKLSAKDIDEKYHHY